MSWLQMPQLIWNAVAESVKGLFLHVGQALPDILGGLVVLLIGWFVAGWLQRFLVQILKATRIDTWPVLAQVGDVLHKGEVKYSLSELLGVFLYWLVVLATFLAAFDLWGLNTAAQLIQRVIGYTPNLIAGVVALVLGLFGATFAAGAVQTAAANAGIGQAKGLGQIARVAVIVFSVVVALEKFLSSIIIQTAFTVVVGSIAIAFALAFGLGCKDIAGKYVGEFFDKLRRR